MSVTKWRGLGVYNSHDLVKVYAQETGEIGVYLAQSSNDGQRINMGVPTGYTVIRPGYYTAQSSQDWHGNMLFNKDYTTVSKVSSRSGSHKERWDAALAEAAEWCAERYKLSGEFVGIAGFGRDRFPVEIATWAKQKLKGVR